MGKGICYENLAGFTAPAGWKRGLLLHFGKQHHEGGNLNYGGVVKNLYLPDRNGRIADVVLEHAG